MRNAFADELSNVAAADRRIVLLSGDIGNRLFNTYKDQFPNRFFNCGVAEANMMTMAAGMAMSGLRPITYTITPFITTRCLEQIRVDVCYHNVPVVIVAVGAGLSYASLGATHHSCEDIAFLRALPNMTVMAPGDAMEVRACLRAALEAERPVYIRIGKKNEPVIHPDVPPINIGAWLPIQEGADICLLSTGNLLPLAVQTADTLAKERISAQVMSCHTIKPLDTAFLADAFQRYAAVVTIEEHSVIGGFGSAVSEWVTDQPPMAIHARLLKIGTRDEFLHEAGDQAHARAYYGLTPDAISKKVITLLQRSNPL